MAEPDAGHIMQISTDGPPQILLLVHTSIGSDIEWDFAYYT